MTVGTHNDDNSSALAARAAETERGDLWDKLRDEIVVPGDGANTPPATAEPPSSPYNYTGYSTNWARAYGRYLVVGGLICGLAIPELASMARPFLVPLLVISLMLALLQVDFGQVVNYTKQKSLIASLIFALLVLTPIFVALEAKAVLVPYGLPMGIADGMILAALAPPLLAAPVIAFLLGLDSLLALVVSLVAHLAAPLTIALLTDWLIGPDISIGVWELAMRLALLIGAGFGIGLFLRVVGLPKLLRSSPVGVATLDGISVITLALLALALMDGVTALTLTDPTFVVLAFVTGFLLNPLLQLLGAALFIKAGLKTSLTVGLLAGYRNTGVLIAVLAGDTDPKILTFLAIVQIPTFLMPMLTNPFMLWIKRTKLDPLEASGSPGP
ncbi:MAG: hypothetical protein QF578_07505 [Alphaproteobacteria bacterium]|nr:hypothetical protein [Alphaproteobacteria bacterium]